MSNLPLGWRRKPPWNCPLCKGKGRVLWQLSSSTKPVEWQCIGRKKPKPPKKKGPLIMAETELSMEKRAVWMEHGASREDSCACVVMKKLDYIQLRQAAVQRKRIIYNIQPERHKLNDPLDDLFLGPYPYPEFLK